MSALPAPAGCAAVRPSTVAKAGGGGAGAAGGTVIATVRVTPPAITNSWSPPGPLSTTRVPA
jgi:hypothetical protein